MGLGQDYIDQLASGDKQKIMCVLGVAGGAAAAGGMAAGLYFAPANAVPAAGTAFNATAAGADRRHNLLFQRHIPIT